MSPTLSRWLARALICCLPLIDVVLCHALLCYDAEFARMQLRAAQRRGAMPPPARRRMPKFFVWLWYTDVRTIRHQNFVLRLNLIATTAALIYAFSELLLGFLPLTPAVRIGLAACTAGFAACTLIAGAVEIKRRCGSWFALYVPGDKNHFGKGDSSLLYLLYAAISLGIARFYLTVQG